MKLVDAFEAALALAVRPLRGAVQTAQRLLAFGLIVLVTILTKFLRARGVVHPRMWEQVRRAGLGLLPFVGLLSLVTGFVLVGQAAAFLRPLGAQDRLGTVLVFSLVRELGPLAAALLVLLRVATATAVELAILRARGEVEALEALGIDPVHVLVMPRVIGLSVSVFCLTILFLIGTLASGYLFCLLQNQPLSLGDYLGQLARALTVLDFPLLILKTLALGAAIAVIACYQGLARPLRLDQVAEAATRAVTTCVVVCVAIDVAFLAPYLLG